MIDTKDMITVAEAAKRLDRSIEQVRRYLREGKLRGQRIGNQWFVEKASLGREELKPLIPPGTIRRILELRRRINAENRLRGGEPFDVVEMLQRHRDDD